MFSFFILYVAALLIGFGCGLFGKVGVGAASGAAFAGFASLSAIFVEPQHWTDLLLVSIIVAICATIFSTIGGLLGAGIRRLVGRRYG